MLLRSFRILLDPQGGEGGSPTPDADRGRKADPEAALQKLLDKHSNDGVALARQLLGENFDLRQKNADLREKLPREGSRVLSADDAKVFDAILSLGPVDEVKRKVREHPDLSGKVSGYEREKAVGEFGRKAGVPPEKLPLLLKLAGNAAFEEKSEKVDGKDVVRVLVKDGDSEPVPFDSYFADALPALRPEAKAEERPRGTPPRNGQVQAPNPIPRAGDRTEQTSRASLTRF